MCVVFFDRICREMTRSKRDKDSSGGGDMLSRRLLPIWSYHFSISIELSYFAMIYWYTHSRELSRCVRRVSFIFKVLVPELWLVKPGRVLVRGIYDFMSWLYYMDGNVVDTTISKNIYIEIAWATVVWSEVLVIYYFYLGVAPPPVFFP